MLIAATSVTSPWDRFTFASLAPRRRRHLDLDQGVASHPARSYWDRGIKILAHTEAREPTEFQVLLVARRFELFVQRSGSHNVDRSGDFISAFLRWLNEIGRDVPLGLILHEVDVERVPDLHSLYQRNPPTH